MILYRVLLARLAAWLHTDAELDTTDYAGGWP